MADRRPASRAEAGAGSRSRRRPERCPRSPTSTRVTASWRSVIRIVAGPGTRRRGALPRRRRPERRRQRPPAASRVSCSSSRLLRVFVVVGSPLGPGSSSQNVVPSPGSLSKPMLPPCASTISRETARPSPVPVMPVAPASPRKNFVKMRLCWSAGIPRPSSRTAIRTPSPLRAATSSTVPPSGEYLIAFERRFPTTCARRFGSPRTVSGRSSSSTSSRCLGLWAAYSCACSSSSRARSTFSVARSTPSCSIRCTSRKSSSSAARRLACASTMPR